jgi:hypothetical protein
MWISKGERPLFFVPIVFTKYFTESGLTGLTSQIPDYLAYELDRIIVTTGDGPSIFVFDVTTVVDSGIHEVE